MSEHPRVERRDLKKIYVCDDVWFGVFAFLDCALLGLKCALLSCRFDALVYKHLKGKDWSLCCLDILENEKGTCTRKLFGGLPSNATQIMIRYGHAKYFPIVSAPPPGIINKFKCLFIRHVDQNVINFLERIPRLFNNEIIVNLYMLCNQNNSWNILTKKIWPLLTSNLTKMVLNVDQLVLLRRFVSANVLRDCTNLRLIGSHNLFPEMPADDRSEASPGQALAKWLHTPLKDGRPKVFNLDSMSNNVKKNIEEIKKAFINDLTPAKYIIGLKFKVVGSAPFVLENGMTRERLTLRHYIAGFCVLTRGPIDWDEKRWAKWDFESINIFRLINNLEKAQRLGRCHRTTEWEQFNSPTLTRRWSTRRWSTRRWSTRRLADGRLATRRWLSRHSPMVDSLTRRWSSRHSSMVDSLTRRLSTRRRRLADGRFADSPMVDSRGRLADGRLADADSPMVDSPMVDSLTRRWSSRHSSMVESLTRRWSTRRRRWSIRRLTDGRLADADSPMVDSPTPTRRWRVDMYPTETMQMKLAQPKGF